MYVLWINEGTVCLLRLNSFAVILYRLLYTSITLLQFIEPPWLVLRL